MRFDSVRSSRPGSLGRTILLAALLLTVVAGSAFARAPKFEIPLKAEWEEALEPLATMPVQSFGGTPTATAYSQNKLRAIHGKPDFHGRSALVTLLYLIHSRRAMTETPVIKVVYPEYAKIMKGSQVSVESYQKGWPEVFRKVGPEPEKNASRSETKLSDRRRRAAGKLQGRATELGELSLSFAILPRAKGDWESPAVSHAGHAHGVVVSDAPINQAWGELMKALAADDPVAGRTAAEALAASVAAGVEGQGLEPSTSQATEVFYYTHAPFHKSAMLYLFATLFYGGALLFRKKKLAPIGYALLALGLSEEVIGIACRWIIAGRAPLSNMYESFTFATAGMILVALAFEAVQRTRLAGFGGALLGAIFMALAHNLPTFDEKIMPLVPALQSVWLTYHVVTIMLSYSAFALSFFVSLCYLMKDLAGGDQNCPQLLRRLPSLASLDSFNYKIIAVGFPLLTVGIVLGAVWANTAWGRAWGFDPKETWSAITWLIYAVYLHVRFIGGWRGRRAAIIALIGFAGVLFTYFGVSYLLPSLHSYVG